MKLVIIFGFAFHVLAWENHALLTYLAVQDLPVMSERVASEPLEDFLRAESRRLYDLLRHEELWSKNHVPYYPAKPNFNLETREAVQSFLMTIRVNPQVRLPLYVQELPGLKKPESAYWLPEEVTLLPKSLTKTGNKFVKIASGESVSVRDVFVTASDEPDYGLDIGLWEDSNTSFGQVYGFGKQPFGNPILEFASQAPFHMGFYHEPKMVYWVSSDLAKTLPESRIHLYYSLAKLAFETGHGYWGWRFAGWGVHYIQDLTQPYHSTLFPGGSTAWMILAGIFDQFGFHRFKEKIVLDVSDGHLKLEEEVYEKCVQSYLGEEVLELNSIRQVLPESLRYSPEYVRTDLTLESHGLSETLPKDQLMRNVGKHTRAWVRTLVESPL